MAVVPATKCQLSIVEDTGHELVKLRRGDASCLKAFALPIPDLLVHRIRSLIHQADMMECKDVVHSINSLTSLDDLGCVFVGLSFTITIVDDDGLLPITTDGLPDGSSRSGITAPRINTADPCRPNFRTSR